MYRLKRRTRIRLAATLAMAYAFCVLVPAVTFAFGDVALVAHCLTDGAHGHGGAHHDHTRASAHAPADHAERGSVGAHDTHGVPSSCCSLVCFTALTCTAVSAPDPATPFAIIATALDHRIGGKNPDRLDRPPIASLTI